MGKKQDTEIYIALVHNPVLSKKGEVICSAVTNLDIHDIARAGKTYGVEKYFVVTTLSDQKILADKIVRHWTDGRGGEKNPDRREALKLISIVDSIEDAVKEIQVRTDKKITIVATTAKKQEADVSFSELKCDIEKGGAFLILFGTAWGLSDEVLDFSDRILAPLQLKSEYNHLSVRSAASIILDRLLAQGYEDKA